MGLLGRLQGDLEKFRDEFDIVGKHLTNSKNKCDATADILARFETKVEGFEGWDEQPALPGSPEKFTDYSSCA